MSFSASVSCAVGPKMASRVSARTAHICAAMTRGEQGCDRLNHFTVVIANGEPYSCIFPRVIMTPSEIPRVASTFFFCCGFKACVAQQEKVHAILCAQMLDGFAFAC